MIKCNLCNSTNNSKYLQLASNHAIYNCNSCLNGFTQPAPSYIEYTEEDFHEQFDFKNIDDLPAQWKDGLYKQYDLIKRYIPANGNILELGCGQGLFLSFLKEKGYQTYAVEPSLSASAIAQKKGLNVKTGYYPEQHFEGVNFDLIIMAQVLEHVEKPLTLLKEIAERNKGKYLLLVQTNFKGIVPLKLKTIWYGWVPDQHYWHFTASGLKNVVKQLGLKVEKIEYSTLEHNNYWLSRLSSYIPFAGDQMHVLIKL